MFLIAKLDAEKIKMKEKGRNSVHKLSSWPFLVCLIIQSEFENLPRHLIDKKWNGVDFAQEIGVRVGSNLLIEDESD